MASPPSRESRRRSVARVARGAGGSRAILSSRAVSSWRGRTGIASLDRTVRYYDGQKWQSFSFSDSVWEMFQSPKYGVLIEGPGEKWYAYDGAQMQLVYSQPLRTASRALWGNKRGAQPYEARPLRARPQDYVPVSGSSILRVPEGFMAGRPTNWSPANECRATSRASPGLPRRPLEQRHGARRSIGSSASGSSSVPGIRARWPAKATV